MLYLGETLTVCFLEAVLRDQRDAVIGELVMDESELETRRPHFASLICVGTARWPWACRRASHTLGRAWSVAFHDHPQAPDGIICLSRLNGQVNLAVYGRAVAKLRPVRLRRLMDIAELAPILSELQVGLTTPDPPDP